MIAHVLNLTRWEWFKVRRRWMPWILLLAVVAFTQIFVWGNYMSYNRQADYLDRSSFGYSSTQPDGSLLEIIITCRDILEGRAEGKLQQLDAGTQEAMRDSIEQMQMNCERQQVDYEESRQSSKQGFVMPHSLAQGLGVAQNVGLILIAILTGSILGTEYGWGTLRTSLVRGTGRWEFLAGKLALMVFVAIAALAIVTSLMAVSSFAASTLAGVSPMGEGEWTDVALMFGKSIYGLAPYIAMAAFFAVITSSSAGGIAASLGYYFGEQILVAILINLFSWFETAADFVLGRNVIAWMLSGSVDTGGGLFGAGGLGDMPGALHSFLVIAAYIVGLAGIAFWQFQRRDVAGAGGQ